jgi:hypothetical protein
MNIETKKPLYRKVNTRARGVHHQFGDDYRNKRKSENSDMVGMAKGVQRGLDYTPLFKFLLSKVGKTWDLIHSEAVSRLDKEDPIFWMVSLDFDSADDVIRVGESSYFSGLYVNEKGILQILDPNIGPETLEPLCGCCTHTLNGKPFSKKYKS